MKTLILTKTKKTRIKNQIQTKNKFNTQKSITT